MPVDAASISGLIDQIVPVNPAASVRGPKYVVKVGKTPVFTADQTRQLLDSIDTATISGLRDSILCNGMLLLPHRFVESSFKRPNSSITRRRICLFGATDGSNNMRVFTSSSGPIHPQRS
jgi:hypothetical protein